VSTQPEEAVARESNWRRRLLTWLIGIVAVVVLAFLAAAFVPRWWSHLVGRQIDGSMTVGVALGLFYGFLFTLVPLLVLFWGFHKRRPWKAWAAFAVAAIVLASPNLMTLGVVVGRGGAAHAAERTLDVEAPGFRNASLAGAIIAVLALAAAWYLLSSRRRARERLSELGRSKDQK
jgi:glucan phosphoethanolaminetransferase (alkaline phosphatase superfamily)